MNPHNAFRGAATGHALPRRRFLQGTAGVAAMLAWPLGANAVVKESHLALPLSWIGNFPPGVALVFLSVGLLEEDGILVALGHVLGILATVLVLALVAALVAAVMVSFGWLTV